MKKIVIVNDLLQGGGVEKLMYDLVWAWHDKFDITVVTNAYDKDFYDLYPANVKYLYQQPYIRVKNKILYKVVRKLRRKPHKKSVYKAINEGNYDVAIAIKEGFKMKDVSLMKADKKFCWVHTDYNAYYYTQNIFHSPENELELMKKFDNIVCVSQNIADGIRAVIGDPGNLIVKYNPIDVDNVLKRGQEPVVDIDSWDKQNSNQDDERPVRFVTVGRQNYQKAYTSLLEACHILERDRYNFEVLVVGAEEPWGDETSRIKSTIKRLGIKNVNFIGGRKNPYKYMAIADWFLSSSIFEGYSLVSQEAAVLEIPLLLTEVSGVRELIGDDEYGLVMENSVIGIYEGMKKVLDNPNLHQIYKEKIIERKQIITYQERMDEIEKLFQ